jgi:hypothetical protein
MCHFIDITKYDYIWKTGRLLFRQKAAPAISLHVKMAHR